MESPEDEEDEVDAVVTKKDPEAMADDELRWRIAEAKGSAA
jgi:hypothetical protein